MFSSFGIKPLKAFAAPATADRPLATSAAKPLATSGCYDFAAYDLTY